MTQSIYVLRGLPGAGKTTHARNLQATFPPGTCTIFSAKTLADKFLAEVPSDVPASVEAERVYAADQIRACFRAELGTTPVIIVDDENLSVVATNFYRTEAAHAGYTVTEVLVGDVTPEFQAVCRARRPDIAACWMSEAAEILAMKSRQ